MWRGTRGHRTARTFARPGRTSVEGEAVGFGRSSFRLAKKKKNPTLSGASQFGSKVSHLHSYARRVERENPAPAATGFEPATRTRV